MGQQDLHIYELVSKIERGEIQLPEMQRRYVWKQTRVRDLLDSLYRNYPSGTILTWEPDEDMPTRAFAIKQDLSGQQRFQLLLDGQQRLTSLSAILRGEPVHVRDRKRPIDILFNLNHPEKREDITEIVENEELEDTTDADSNKNTMDATEDELLAQLRRRAFAVHTKKLASLQNWISVTEVFKESSDTPFLRKAGVTNMEHPCYDKYTARLKRLRDIKKYIYRVDILDREKSYEEVTDIFVRVNALGTKLRSSDLALAQITAKWQGSLKILEEFETECREQHGFDLELATHLRNLVAFATDRSQFKAIGNLSKDKLTDAWENAKKGMHYALDFLRSNVGIDSPALLSSPFLIITLAKYAHMKKYHLLPEEEERLRYWILLANAKGRYSRGSSETLLDQDLTAIRKGDDIKVLRQMLQTQVGRLQVLPSDLENRNSRSAYFKTMFLAFRQDDARDWQDQLVISLKHSGVQHSLQFHHVFPRAVLEKLDLPHEKINDICNLAFISGNTNRKLSDKEPAEYLPDVQKNAGEAALKKQCIPNDPNLWTMDAYSRFLEKRRELVAERLNRFLGLECNPEED